MLTEDIINEGVFTAPSFFEPQNIKELELNELVQHIEDILRIRFNESYKQVVDIFSNRITFSCPYCGDSDNFKKKRGNIFFESMFFHCFVCGQHTSTYNLIKKFKEDITQSELLRLKELQSIKSSHINSGINVLNLDLVHKYTLDISIVNTAFSAGSVLGTKGGKYLMERGQNNLENFAYSKRYQSVFIYNLDKNGKVLGFVSRSLRPDVTNKYLSYKLSSIYNQLNLELPEDIEYLDKLSLIFNILKINFNDEITVFEGPFDCYLFRNSVALSGLSKNLPFSGDNIRYWMDNDEQGLKKTKEYLKDGKKIFLWGKYLKDHKIPSYHKIKDLTDLILYSKNNNIVLKPFESYFSDSKIDLFFL